MLYFNRLPQRIKQSFFYYLSLSFFFYHSLENKLPKVKFGWFPFHLSDGYSIYSLFIGFKYMECEKLISLRLTFRF